MFFCGIIVIEDSGIDQLSRRRSSWLVRYQLIVEPDRGLCENHKPNRFVESKEKRLTGALPFGRALVFWKGEKDVEEHGAELLYRAALVWSRLTERMYRLTYGYKKQLYQLDLTFSPEEFPHLAGFQYLKDVSLPRYNARKMVEMILKGKITDEKIRKGVQYQELVEPRLRALVRLEEILENEFQLYSYLPEFYPFTTRIKADYLIASPEEPETFVFIIRASDTGEMVCDFLCCSAFEKGERDYRINQRQRSLLKKERIHRPSQEITTIYDRLTESNP